MLGYLQIGHGDFSSGLQWIFRIALRTLICIIQDWEEEPKTIRRPLYSYLTNGKRSEVRRGTKCCPLPLPPPSPSNVSSCPVFPPAVPYCDQTWFVLFQSNYLCGLGLGIHYRAPGVHTSPVSWSLFKVSREIKMSILHWETWDLNTHNNRPGQSFYYNAGKLGKNPPQSPGFLSSIDYRLHRAESWPRKLISSVSGGINIQFESV